MNWQTCGLRSTKDRFFMKTEVFYVDTSKDARLYWDRRNVRFLARMVAPRPDWNVLFGRFLVENPGPCVNERVGRVGRWIAYMTHHESPCRRTDIGPKEFPRSNTNMIRPDVFRMYRCPCTSVYRMYRCGVINRSCSVGPLT